jgi:hypothetical protein
MTWIPAIEQDPSWKVVVDLIMTRFRQLPVAKAVVWHMPSADAATLAHLAQMLGVGDVDLSVGEPLDVLSGAVDLRKRRGTAYALRQALLALGYDDILYSTNTVWLHDGTCLHDGLYTHGSDNHWAIVVVTLDLAAPLTLSQAQLVWRALDGWAGGARDWPRLRVRVGGLTVQFYRDVPAAA